MSETNLKYIYIYIYIYPLVITSNAIKTFIKFEEKIFKSYDFPVD